MIRFVFSLAVFVVLIDARSMDRAQFLASQGGALAKECLHIVDQDGMPVAGARVWGGMKCGDGYDDFVPISDVSDTNGVCVVRGVCTDMIRCDVTKRGYYPSEFVLLDYCYTHSLSNGMWHPYGQGRKVVLKQVKDPARLCSFSEELQDMKIPVFGEWIGFDFERQDWTTPYGKGVFRDVLLRFTAEVKSLKEFRYEMDVSFTNNPCAGAYVLKMDKASALMTEYFAQTNAQYEVSFRFVNERTPGGRRHANFLDNDSYLVFRTRTRIDDDGNLTGAHYGKILGRWISGAANMLLSDGCFNPKENDVSLEDSRTLRNVLRNMK